MLGEPPCDRRWRGGVPVARGEFGRGFLQGIAAVVQREGFEDFVDGIGFVAHGARAWREGAPARATAEERDALKFLFSRALFYEGAAVAMRAALGRFD